MSRLDELLAERETPPATTRGGSRLDELLTEMAPASPSPSWRQRVGQALQFHPSVLASKGFQWLTEKDREAAQKLWGYTPEQMGEDVLERTGSPLAATGMHMARELATPLNIGLAGAPGALGMLKGLRRQPAITREPIGGIEKPIPGARSSPQIEEAIVQPPPVVPLDKVSAWRQKWQQAKQHMAAEPDVTRVTPESPVISGVEGHRVGIELEVENLTSQEWVKALRTIPAPEWKRLEEQAVGTWNAGGRTPEAYVQAVQGLPAPFQRMLQHRDQMFQAENAVREKWGLDLIPKQEGPYFPRMTTEEWKGLRSVYRGSPGEATGLQQTVKGFQRERQFETLAEGERLGVEYRHPMESFLLREANGASLRMTDELITELEQAGVLNRTRQAALRNSPTGKVWPLEGMPFSPEGGRWWVRTEEEARFLRQNLRALPDRGDIIHYANQFVRNPSLVNPLPHIVKNMGYKLGLMTTATGGKFSHLLPDIRAYMSGAVEPQMLAEFNKVMPFTQSGRTLHDILMEAGPRTVGQETVRQIGRLNRFSAKEIFSKWDPAMRYAKWREYVNQGMPPQEAANNTWQDLIRYGRRSDLVDFWKSTPLNFFVPWRTGTVATTVKALRSEHWGKAAGFIGAMDYIREMDYRQNGRWTHLPIDYIERPMASLTKEDGRVMEALGTGLTTAAFGPGGDFAARSIITVLNDLQGKGQKQDLRNLFWGLGQIYDLLPEFEKWEQTGDVSHLGNMLGLIVLGRHGTTYGAPPRVGQHLPEWLPGLEKSAQVKEAEMRMKVVKLKHEQRDERSRIIREAIEAKR